MNTIFGVNILIYFHLNLPVHLNVSVSSSSRHDLIIFSLHSSPQKWQCLEDSTGMMRLFKCKGMAGLYSPRAQGLLASRTANIYNPSTPSDGCDCDPTPMVKKKRLLTKRSENWSLALN